MSGLILVGFVYCRPPLEFEAVVLDLKPVIKFNVLSLWAHEAELVSASRSS